MTAPSPVNAKLMNAIADTGLSARTLSTVELGILGTSAIRSSHRRQPARCCSSDWCSSVAASRTISRANDRQRKGIDSQFARCAVDKPARARVVQRGPVNGMGVDPLSSPRAIIRPVFVGSKKVDSSGPGQRAVAGCWLRPGIGSATSTRSGT